MNESCGGGGGELASLDLSGGSHLHACATIVKRPSAPPTCFVSSRPAPLLFA